MAIEQMKLRPFLTELQAVKVGEILDILVKNGDDLSPIEAVLVLATASAAILTSAKRDDAPLNEVIENYAAQITEIAEDLERADQGWEGALDLDD